jgi:phage gp29-like protein
VRDDLRDDDIKREGRTVRGQIIAPMCAYKFGRDVPLPYFRRVKPEPIDRKAEGEVIEVAQRIGMKVGEDWARERLGVPKPQEGEATLEPADAGGGA